MRKFHAVPVSARNNPARNDLGDPVICRSRSWARALTGASLSHSQRFPENRIIDVVQNVAQLFNAFRVSGSSQDPLHVSFTACLIQVVRNDRFSIDHRRETYGALLLHNEIREQNQLRVELISSEIGVMEVGNEQKAIWKAKSLHPAEHWT